MCYVSFSAETRELQQKRHKENVDAEVSFALAKNLPQQSRT